MERGEGEAYTLRAVVSLLRTGTEVLGRARVDAELLAALAVVLNLALVGHAVLLVALLGLALELDTLDIALVLGHVLALGVGSRGALGGLTLLLVALGLFGLILLLLLFFFVIGSVRLLFAVSQLFSTLSGGFGVVVVGIGVGSAGPEVVAGWDGHGDGGNEPVEGA